MYLERALLQIGVPDIGMDRGEPVQRPTFRRRESQPPPGRAVASDFDVDLKVRRFRERDPDFAAQRHPLRRRQQSRCPDQRAAPVGHARARGGRAQPGDGDAHQVFAPFGLLKQRGGSDLDDRLL